MHFHPGAETGIEATLRPPIPGSPRSPALLATVTVNTSQVVQPVNTQLPGVNIGSGTRTSTPRRPKTWSSRPA